MTLSLLLPLIGGGRASAKTLFDFDTNFDISKVEFRSVKGSLTAAAAGQGLRLQVGHDQDWPGITLKAPGGNWDLSGHLRISMEVKNLGLSPVFPVLRVDNEGADGSKNCNTAGVEVPPGETKTLQVSFKSRPPAGSTLKLFGMNGYPGGVGEGDNTIDTAKVTQVLVFLAKPDRDHDFVIDSIRAEGEAQALPDPKTFLPFIDEFGQYIHADWPGKLHGADEWPARIKAEEGDWEARPGPLGWNKYGGWGAGPTLKATGFFYTAKHQGRWFLVDPEGKLFFSHGVDVVMPWQSTPIEERDTWFKNPPWDQAGLQEFVGRADTVLHNHYKGRNPRTYDFGAANLKRKYGGGWRAEFGRATHLRLRSWGYNTIGNWSDDQIYLMRKTPYVVAAGSWGAKPIRGSEGFWGQFPDPFDPGFRDTLRRNFAGFREKGQAGDPWCLGFFVDNELAWGNETDLAAFSLASPPDQGSKLVFIGDLKAKYGEVAALNKVWGTNHADWDDLGRDQNPPDREKAKEDLRAFTRRIAEEYFKVNKEELKAVAPNNLYLGCRFAWVNDLALAASLKYVDVVSYNLYKNSVADFKLPGGSDFPVIIGEFHFGALDRGMFHQGLVPVADQYERAAAYKNYMNGCLKNPLFVGAHWFQYVDECTTGRYLDGENYQIGLLSITDTPYPETIDAARHIGASLYTTR